MFKKTAHYIIGNNMKVFNHPSSTLDITLTASNVKNLFITVEI